LLHQEIRPEEDEMGMLADVVQGPSATMKAQIEDRLGEEVLVAGQLRQGSEPSLASMITGTALIGLMRPRRTKSLPKTFVLAMTPVRVVAFKGTGVGDEFGDEYGVIVRGDEQGSWPRDQVSIEGSSDVRLPDGATLVLAGERIPIFRPNDRGDNETDELIKQLAQ
jgi:hypothetical protein